MGCNPTSLGYGDGGLDTYTASKKMEAACQPSNAYGSVVNGYYFDFFDACGGHAAPNMYHFHQRLSCMLS